MLAGDAELTGKHTERVASQSDGETTYVVCNGECECRDFPRASEGWCKHRLSIAILRRATERATVQAKALDAPAAEEAQKSAAAEKSAPVVALPEAPASANVLIKIGGRQVQVALRGTDEGEVLARLEKLLARYPLPEAPAAAQLPTPPDAPAAAAEPERHGEEWCEAHQAFMRLHEKHGQRWRSHRIETGPDAGTWCKGQAA